MADAQQLALIKQGSGTWNEWRRRNLSTRVDLTYAGLTDADLTEADLTRANLTGADLTGANLTDADLTSAQLAGAQLVGAEARGVNLCNALLDGADLTFANLTEAILVGAKLNGTFLTDGCLIGANLSLAVLIGANLSDTDLTGANLFGAKLIRASLLRADLTDANMTDAVLVAANLTGAKLLNANAGAFLAHANLTGADLAGVDLQSAVFSETVLADLDLSQAVGLESSKHLGPSALDHRTLLRSGNLPLPFLQGCGLPDRLIDQLPTLFNAERFEFDSCFISYSTVNEDFAKRLHADLQARGIRCWFAPHDMQSGKKIHDQIDEAIRAHDRLLLILSSESMSSRWVKTEIEKAREKEVRLNRPVLFPIALVPFDEIKRWRHDDGDLGEDIARRVRDFFIPDFTGWTHHDIYEAAFEKLVDSLKNTDAWTPGD